MTTVHIPSLTSSSAIQNVYDSNGIVVQQNNHTTGGVIWHTSDITPTGDIVQMEYGNGYTIKQNYRNSDDSLTDIRHIKSSNGSSIVDVGYDYNMDRGVLNSRNNRTFNKDEKFEYDKLNRLLKESLDSDVVKEYTYDPRGRITSNTDLGKYNYSGNDYKLQNIAFNIRGQQLNSERGFATVTYNAFNSPLSISLPGKDGVSFECNILKTRYRMTTGKRTEVKFYSSDFKVEIIKRGSRTEIINYITGDPYSANYIKKTVKTKVATSDKFYFLHRDNIGSVLAITDASDGSVVEQRYFDAWGNLKLLKDTDGNVSTDENFLRHAELFIDRGYTGHEHLHTVGLINMNARIYDPVLRKFLSADSLVPDLYNTQSYDRYSYVLNNPLLYLDLDGNEPITVAAAVTAVAIAVGVGVATHIVMNAIAGVPVWYGLGKAATTSAIMGAVSMGIGSAASSAAASYIGKAALQAGMHAASGGIMSALETGNFGSGFLSAMISSIVSSGLQSLGTNFTGSGAMQDANRNYISFNKFGNTYMKAVMVVAGGLTGGISATIAGGKFADGFKQGIITSGLNHVAHVVSVYVEDQQRKYIIESQLEEAGYDPWGRPKITAEYAQAMMDKVAILRAQNELAGGRGKIVGYTNATEYHGASNAKTGNIYLARNSLATASNMSLAVVIFHELKHLVYYWNPSFRSMLKYEGAKRKDYEHYLIYKEVNNILLNGTLTFGTRDALKSLNSQYGWKY